jgi:hypothetical protein
MVVDGETNATGLIDFSLRSGVPAQNAECTGATVIDPGALPHDVGLDTTFNPSNLDGSRSVEQFGGGAPDAWYSFTLSASGKYVFGARSADSLNPLNPDLSLIDEAFTIFTGACGNPSELVSRDEISYGEMSIINLDAGVTCTILVEGFNGIVDFGLVRLYVDGPSSASSNDQCSGAVGIPPGAIAV